MNKAKESSLLNVMPYMSEGMKGEEEPAFTRSRVVTFLLSICTRLILELPESLTIR